MAQTADYAIPFPSQLDAVNVPADLQALAERVDRLLGLLDSGLKLRRITGGVKDVTFGNDGIATVGHDLGVVPDSVVCGASVDEAGGFYSVELVKGSRTATNFRCRAVRANGDTFQGAGRVSFMAAASGEILP
jgi:hypothetical protein